jgi:hypothetical protein
MHKDAGGALAAGKGESRIFDTVILRMEDGQRIIWMR